MEMLPVSDAFGDNGWHPAPLLVLNSEGIIVLRKACAPHEARECGLLHFGGCCGGEAALHFGHLHVGCASPWIRARADIGGYRVRCHLSLSEHAFE